MQLGRFAFVLLSLEFVMKYTWFAGVWLLSAAVVHAQPIDPWAREGPIEVDGLTLSMPALRATLIGQSDLIRSVSEEMGEDVDSAGPRGGTPGVARLVECNGLFGYDTIQSAIDDAQDGDVVVVFPNLCTPQERWFENVNMRGKKIRLQSADPEDPQFVESTVIDGGAPTESSLRSVVTCLTYERAETVIHGLTLTNGSGFQASTTTEYTKGGGLYCSGAGPSIWGCRVIKNRARDGGGIYYNSPGSPELFRGEVRQCLFSDNESIREGGALFLSSGTGSSKANIDFRSCIFRGNQADYGAVAYCDSGTGNTMTAPRFFSCRMIENTSLISGIVFAEAITGNASSQPEFHSCLFEGNKARSGVFVAQAVLSTASAIVHVTNCTVVNNILTTGTTMTGSPGPQGTIAAGVVKGSIFWGNAIKEQYTEFKPSSNSAFAFSIENSNLERLSEILSRYPYIIDGDRNFSSYPEFVEPGGVDDAGTPDDPVDDFLIPGDYHLLVTSPCIDAGDPAYETFDGDLDFEGELRVMTCQLDVGADEFNPARNPADFTADGLFTLDDSSAFIAALLDRPAECGLASGDTNHDGNVDGLDISGFVAALLE